MTSCLRFMSEYTHKFISQTDYQHMKISLCHRIEHKDLQYCIFLCHDHLNPKIYNTVTSMIQLLDKLEKTRLLSLDNLEFLTKMLLLVGRKDLVRSHLAVDKNMDIPTVKAFTYFSSYRILLLKILKCLDNKETELLAQILPPQSRARESTDAVTIVTALENARVICPSDVTQLMRFSECVGNKELQQLIIDFWVEALPEDYGMGMSVFALSDSQWSLSSDEDHENRDSSDFNLNIATTAADAVNKPQNTTANPDSLTTVSTSNSVLSPDFPQLYLDPDSKSTISTSGRDTSTDTPQLSLDENPHITMSKSTRVTSSDTPHLSLDLSVTWNSNNKGYIDIPNREAVSSKQSFNLPAHFEQADVDEVVTVSTRSFLSSSRSEILNKVIPKFVIAQEQSRALDKDADVHNDIDALKTPVSPEVEGLPCYDLTNKPKGICIIINNELFKNAPSSKSSVQFNPRTGSKYDAERVRSVFTRCGLDCLVYEDLTADQMERLFAGIAKKDHSSTGCLVCVLLTHGVEGQVFGIDNRPVSLHTITSHFSAEKCPGLRNKPKMFFIQACRGFHQDINPVPSDYQSVCKEQDFLLYYATTEGDGAYRSYQIGAWFIQELVRHLETLYKSHDLLSILCQVSSEVIRLVNAHSEGRYSQCPTLLSTLTKRVMFS